MGKSNNYKRNQKVGGSNGSNRAMDTRSGNRSASSKSRSQGSNRQADNSNYSNTVRTSHILASNEQLLRDTGHLSFSHATGLEYLVRDSAEAVKQKVFTVPGVMAIDIIPTLGIEPGKESVSSINVCAKALYAKMWAKRTGASTAYDASDVMLYAIAMANMSMFHAHLRRAYGVARNYSVTNRYTPYTLLKAMNFQPDDIINHLPRFRALINNLAFAMSSFAMPSGIPILSTWTEMVQNIYVDGDSDKAQFYLYVPSTLYGLEETDEGGTGLFKFEMGSSITLDQLESLIQTWTELLLSSQDFASISGDLIRTFDNLVPIALPVIDEDYKIDWTYDPVVLLQIANTVCVDYVSDVTQVNNDIYQSVTSNAPSSATSQAPDGNLILNFPMGEVSPELVFLATRGTAIVAPLPNSSGTKHDVFCGAYAVTKFRIFVTPDKSVEFKGHTPKIYEKGGSATAAVGIDLADDLIALLYMSNFAFHPYMTLDIVKSTGAGAPTNIIYYGNIHNFTLVDAKELTDINRVYMNAQYGLPYNV